MSEPFTPPSARGLEVLAGRSESGEGTPRSLAVGTGPWCTVRCAGCPTRERASLDPVCNIECLRGTAQWTVHHALSTVHPTRREEIPLCPRQGDAARVDGRLRAGSGPPASAASGARHTGAAAPGARFGPRPGRMARSSKRLATNYQPAESSRPDGALGVGLTFVRHPARVRLVAATRVRWARRFLTHAVGARGHVARGGHPADPAPRAPAAARLTDRPPAVPGPSG
jgi:hypothetical protein